MTKLINLIYSTPLINHEKVDYVNYVEFTDGDIVAMKSKLLPAPCPIFIVGYALAKKLNFEVDILNKEIRPNTILWEFSYEENRAEHIEGVFDVISRRILDIRYANFPYELIDPIFNNIREDHQVFELVKPVEYGYFYKDMGYLYNSAKQIIYGVDLTAYEFFGFNKGRIVGSIITQSPCKLDPEGDIFVEYKLTFPFVNNLKRYLVLLLLQNASK
ncbi:MAG TPA: hypothetical protein VD815_00930 [Candidatus Saccharimonadales bacterium]|nr:hypothetical protein [Candidatus Saccharimonadales bacterium]